MKILYRWISLPSLLLVALIAGCAGVKGLPETGAKFESPSLGLRLRVAPADAVSGDNQQVNTQVLHVIEVKSGRSAEAAGIKVGDILLELNGKPVSGMADSVAILQNSHWGDVLSASIMRDDQIFKMPVPLKRQHHKKMVQPVPEVNTSNAAMATVLPAGDSMLNTNDSQTVLANGASGGQEMIVAKDPAVENQLATVSVDHANVRADASTSSEIVMSLSRGAKVMITDEMGGWFGIVTQDDRKIPGFMHGSVVTQ